MKIFTVCALRNLNNKKYKKIFSSKKNALKDAYKLANSGKFGNIKIRRSSRGTALVN